MPYRVTPPPIYGQLFINDLNDKEGWSEGYWINTSDMVTALDTLINKIWKARRWMLTRNFSCVMARVHNTVIRGSTLVETRKTPLTFKDDWNHLTGNQDEAECNNLSLWCRFTTANPKVHAVRPIHGLPGSIFNEFGSARDIKIPDTQWAFAFNKYKTALVANCQLVHLVSKVLPIPPATKLVDGQADTTLIATITNVQYPGTARYRKTGRPFGLLRGRRAS